MIIVSDTSPIINLAIIGRLDILPDLFGKIIIPQTVFDEITIQGNEMPGADEVREATWIEVKKCTNTELVQALQLQVEAGEAEAIGLALELKVQLLLIEERMGNSICPLWGYWKY